MILLHVYHDDDEYACVTFENAYPNLKDAYDKAVANGGTFEETTDDGAFEVTVIHFDGPMNRDAFNLIKDVFGDYDQQKGEDLFLYDET